MLRDRGGDVRHVFLIVGGVAVEYGSTTPAGTVISFMGNLAPDGYLACDGATYGVADYPVLAAFFKEQFGSVGHFGGDGASTFGVPDLRGEFLRGTGANSHSAQGSGSSVGVHQDATRIPWVTKMPGRNGIQVNTTSSDETIGDGPWNPDFQWPRAGWISANASASNYSASSNSGPYTTRPTNTSILYCIKY